MVVRVFKEINSTLTVSYSLKGSPSANNARILSSTVFSTGAANDKLTAQSKQFVYSNGLVNNARELRSSERGDDLNDKVIAIRTYRAVAPHSPC